MPTLALLLFLFTATALGQNFADKDYYLVDSLNLATLAQSDRLLVDSCLELYHTATQDTDKVNSLNGICENMMDQSWHKYQHYQLRIIEQALSANPPTPVLLSLRISMAGALNNIGFIHQVQGDIPVALKYYHNSLKIREEISDSPDEAIAKSGKRGMAESYINIGFIHYNQGAIPLALDYYHKSLKIREELGNKQEMAYSYNNIGVIHDNQGDIPLALEHYHKSLNIREEISDKKGIATSLANIGTLHLKSGGLTRAREMGKRGLEIARELGFPDNIEHNAGLLSKVAKHEGNPDYAPCASSGEVQRSLRDV